MNEKYKNWLKKLGVAGFLFFLIKGILWLIFGAAIYKWLKSLIIISAASLMPFITFTQPVSFSTNQFIIHQTDTIPPNIRLDLSNNKKPFFCRLEDKLNIKGKSIFSFRLGSLEYSNMLEYSKFRNRKEYDLK
jgi:hypothetical protein